MANRGFREHLVHTGQHYDQNMSEVFFDEMKIPKPDQVLEFGALSHGAMVGRMLEKIESIVVEQQPAAVVVYGDTNSTLAGAIAGSKLNIPVVHVEAGLRSFEMRMPEEVNRVLTDRISTLLFCPTDVAVENLKRENIDHMRECTISRVGDVMIDAIEYYVGEAEAKSTVIPDLGLIPEEFVLVTLHRQENTDSLERLGSLVTGLNELNQSHKIVVPLHPRTKKQLNQFNLELKCRTIDPVGYFDMLQLIRNSGLVVTDSGGLQKEAYWLGKHCVTMRDQTEWVELVKLGSNVLVGANGERLVTEAKQRFGQQVMRSNSIYGAGDAGGKIYNEICKLIDVKS